MSVQLAKQAMLEAFKQKRNPTNFLAGFFRTPSRNIRRARTVVIDVKRNEEAIAIDVVRGTGGRHNLNKRFTTKEYTPPMYDEYTSYFEEELNERMPGVDPFNDPAYLPQLLALLTDDQAQLQAKILRAIEVQAAQVLFTGSVTLQNADSLDYKQKATHGVTVGTAWSAAGGLPLDDISSMADTIRKDGKVDPDTVVMGEQAAQDFLNNAQVIAQGNLRRIDRISISDPVPNVNGATFHGTFSAGSYTFQMWTYPQFYEVPTGYSLPNEGTDQAYIPTDRVLVISSKTRMDLVYAGVPSLVNRVAPELQSIGISAVPANIAIDFHPYGYTDEKRVCLQSGVRSAPLCIPTQIDGFGWLDVTP